MATTAARPISSATTFFPVVAYYTQKGKTTFKEQKRNQIRTGPAWEHSF